MLDKILNTTEIASNISTLWGDISGESGIVLELENNTEYTLKLLTQSSNSTYGQAGSWVSGPDPSIPPRKL